MTTPARDDVQKFLTSDRTYTVYPDGSIHNIQSFANSVTSSEDHRPQSVSHPVNSDGFRPPTDWFHRGARMIAAPKGVAGYVESGYKYVFEFGGNTGSGSPIAMSKAGQGNLSNRALVACLNDLKGQSFNTGVFLGEARESLSMIELTLSSIIGGIKQYKRRRPKDWLKVVKHQVGALKRSDWKLIPESWLSLQYGWIPLMADVSGACSALSSLADKTAPRVRVKGQATERYQQRNSLGVNSISGLGVEVSTSITSHCKYIMYYELVDGQAALKSRLGLTNPLEIVWEVLPYSFIVDWFAPIGPWLGTLDAPNGWRFLSGTKSLMMKGTEKVTNRTKSASRKNWSHGLSPALYEKFDFSRTVLSTPPVPGLYVKSPISTKHAANLYALLAVTLGR